MQRLLGIAGQAGAGKDTAARVLLAHDWVQITFAGPIKDMLWALLVSRDPDNFEMYDGVLHGSRKGEPLAALNGRTARHALQTLGTEWGRNCIHSDIWIDTALDRARNCRGSVVITDVRFRNEAAAIRREGGKVLRIVRGDRDPGTIDGTHASEAEVDLLDVDGEIVNNGTIEDLHAAVLSFVKRVWGE